MRPIDVAGMKQRLAELAARVGTEPLYRCVACRDSGIRASNDGGVERVGPCPGCRRLVAEGVPAPFHGVTFTDVRQVPGNQRALQFARAFVEPAASRDLFLTGPVGTGKTLLAIATANEFAAARRLSALFVRWPMTLHRLQPGTLDDEERRRMEHRLFSSPLLVIDDLAAERDAATDFTRRMAYLTYEARGDAGLRTIVTSNLGLDELAAHQADDRLSSRLTGRCDVVEVDGVDQRVVRRLRAV